MLGDEPSFEVVPRISDTDIDALEKEWGVRFDKSRRDVLRFNDCSDIVACPGSGKTTLLVAKLALLARKWTHRRRGVCVLSHTNVARSEVEARLSISQQGANLLGYPHFIGTIHAFINEFLALPQLRSEYHPVRMVDDEANATLCVELLHGEQKYWKLRGYLNRSNRHDPDSVVRDLRLVGPEQALDSAGKKIPGDQADSYWLLDDIKQRVISRGIWRHDDMFSWADKLLAEHPEVVSFIQWRFPVVFIDEMQDTSDEQNHILTRLFPPEGPSLRQRFGDSNQAIYDFDNKTESSVDAFPRIDSFSIANSMRFGPSIAIKARMVAPSLPPQGLLGAGPPVSGLPSSLPSSGMSHTIFVFEPEHADQVLPAYAALLLKTFPESAIRSDTFAARAIGRIGRRRGAGGKAGPPFHLGDYWPGYQPNVAASEPLPKSLVGHLQLAQRRRGRSGECADAIQLAVRALIHLVGTIVPAKRVSEARGVRWLQDALAGDHSALFDLRQLLWRWCVVREPLVAETWPQHVLDLRRILSPIIDGDWSPEADLFTAWPLEQEREPVSVPSSEANAPNRYRYTSDGRSVDIDVGTVHSVKGQTHTATLVLETYYKVRDLTELLPWLAGCPPKKASSTEMQYRRKIVYTAMTRPTHLLCLAIRRDGMTANRAGVDIRDALRDMGWAIHSL